MVQIRQNQELLRPANGLGHALPPQVPGSRPPFPVSSPPLMSQHPHMVPVPVPIRVPIPGVPGLNPQGGLQPIRVNDTMFFNLPEGFRGYFGPAGTIIPATNPIMNGPSMGPMVPVGPIGPILVPIPGQPSPSNSSVHSDTSLETQNLSPGSKNTHKWNPNAKSFTPGQPWNKPDSDQTSRDPNAQKSGLISMENNPRRNLEDEF